MMVLLVWFLCLFNRINKNNLFLLKKQTIQSHAYIKWINNILKPKQISIDKIDDLIDGKNLNSLVEVLWDDSIDDSLYSNYNEKKYQTNNFLNFIQYIQTKSINVPKYKIKSIIDKKKSYDLLEIVWNIISYLEVDNTYFNGIKGKVGLLKLINKLSDKKYENFTDSWQNGTTIIKLLSQFYPDEINISENISDLEYAITCLNKVGAPIYVDNESNDYFDENSIILQYATLFHYLSWPNRQSLNTTIHLYNSNPNYYNINYLYVDTGYPNYKDGIIPLNDLPNFITYNNRIIQKINKHYKVNMPSRYPIHIAYIKNENGIQKVVYEKEIFQKILSRAGSKPIIFASCLGRYQQGKTTLNSGITANYGYTIGNGYRETTKGVYIDGPYDINYLYERFNVSIRDDIYYKGNDILSPVVYFFDIEGYDGQMHGNDHEKNNELFIKMCTPFLCLSSTFILLSERNANVYEIKSFFERVKVSKLTTYSINDDSNGALQLHIVFNRYNEICNYDNDKHKKINIRKSIKDFQKQMKNEWIGAQNLTNYGIKYNFYPILEGLSQYYENGLFFDVFSYFAQKIVKSFEKVSEGKFVRSAIQSINLFNYIVEHSDDENFEEMVKLLIKAEHENSFETFSIKSYNVSIKKIFPKIDKEFEQYCKINNFDIKINSIKNRYIRIGDEIIIKDLSVVQDHPKVALYMDKLHLAISNKIYEKQNELIRYKKQLTQEHNTKIEQKADQLSLDYKNKMFKKFDDEKNFNFNQTKIQNYVNSQTNQIKFDLFHFKESENLFLVSDIKINKIYLDKKQLILGNIDKHMNNEKIVFAQFEEEVNLNQTITKLFMNKINDEYCYMEEQLISNLKGNLMKCQFYRSNFQNLANVVQSTQKLIKGYIQSRKGEIINDILYDLINKNESNSEIVKRLKQKNQISIDDNKNTFLIDSYKNDLILKIDQVFDQALYELAKITVKKKSQRWLFRRKIEQKTIKEYPNGMRDETKWQHVRFEGLSFKELFTESFNSLITEEVIKDGCKNG